MRVPKKYLIYSLFLIFFSFFFVNNSYALADYVINWTSSEQGTPYVICDNTDSNLVNCSDYDYIIFERGLNSYNGYSSVQITNINFSNITIRVPNRLTSTYTLFDDVSKIQLNSATLTSITITLTDNIGTPCPEPPSGSITLSENGTYDVTSYAEAVVDVPATVIQGDYHDDLVRIYKAIMTCGAVVLVLYFFYCIYRMIIKSTGGKQ